MTYRPGRRQAPASGGKRRQAAASGGKQWQVAASGGKLWQVAARPCNSECSASRGALPGPAWRVACEWPGAKDVAPQAHAAWTWSQKKHDSRRGKR